MGRPRLAINQRVAVGAVYVAALFMTIMDSTVVNVALPAIGRAFHTPPTSVDSVAIAYLVALAVFIPASGFLGDRFGPKRVLMIAVAAFTAASGLCGLADSLAELVAFRILQGVAGGMLTPIGMSMLFRVFPPEDRLRAVGLLVIPTTIAPATGPIIGGLLVSEVSWRWVFIVNVPIGIAVLLFGMLAVAEHDTDPVGSFDLKGFVLSGLGLGLLMYGVSEGPDGGWGSARVLAAAIAGLSLLVAAVVVELRTERPLVALRLLSDNLFRSANWVTFAAFTGFIGTLYVASLYYQDGRGLSALTAGLSIAPEAVGGATGSQLASRVLYPLLGPRRHIIVGLVGTSICMCTLALMGAHTSLWWARLTLFGVGFTLVQVVVPTQTTSFATIPAASTSSASTMFNTLRQLSSALGVALLTTVIVAVGATHRVNGRALPNLAAYHVAFLTAAGIALLGLLAARTIDDHAAAHTIPPGRFRRKLLSPSPAA